MGYNESVFCTNWERTPLGDTAELWEKLFCEQVKGAVVGVFARTPRAKPLFGKRHLSARAKRDALGIVF